MLPKINKRETVVISLFVILTFIPVFLLRTPDMDEIWNYQFARRLLFGQIPYKDFFLLQAPFALQINSLFLDLFSDKLITMRYVAIGISSFNGIILYVILRLLNNTIVKSFFGPFIYACLVFVFPQNNYSWFAILFLSAALLLEILKIKYASHKTRGDFFELLIGLLLGLTTISKQNIGCLGLLGSAIFLAYYTYQESPKFS